jgi:hypothetical protein
LLRQHRQGEQEHQAPRPAAAEHQRAGLLPPATMHHSPYCLYQSQQAVCLLAWQTVLLPVAA